MHQKYFIFIYLLTSLFWQLVPEDCSAALQTEIGNPFITNYSPSVYRAHGQNWAAVQDSGGLLYFANSAGVVLQYDGLRWTSIAVGNGSIVRDIQLDASGKIFVGMQNDFGYLQSDDDGRIVYQSLLNKADYPGILGDIWKIGITGEFVYFLERHHLFRIQKKYLNDSLHTLQPIKAKTRFHNLFKGRKNRFFVHQVDVGLMETDTDSLRLVVNGSFFKNDLLAAVLPYSASKWLVLTRSRGIFIYSEKGQIERFKTNCEDLLSKAHLYAAIQLHDGNLAIASKYGGLFILAADGRLLQKIDESTGLANNTVWSVFEDARQGLWLSLNTGIAFADHATPFTVCDVRNGLKGSVHDIIRYQGNFYVTTNYGLFVSGTDKSIPGRIHFEALPGISTSGWDMIRARGMLFISANSGIYKLEKGRARLVFKYDPWVFYQSKLDSRRVYIGLAAGVASFYIAPNGQLLDEGKIPGIDIEARTLAEDDHANLWVASSYHGVLRADSTAAYFKNGIVPVITHYNQENGLPSNLSTLIFENKKKILFSTSAGVYRFDSGENRFILDADFAEMNLRKHSDDSYMLARTDSAGNVWSHVGQKIVLNELNAAGNYRLLDSLFRGIPEEEIQCIYPDGQRSVWFGQRDGIFIYDLKKENVPGSSFKTLIRSVVLNSDSIMPDRQSINYSRHIPELQYNADNMLRFTFAVPFYIRPGETVYRYRLRNFNRAWSAWTSESRKDYTNLPYGRYSFDVESRNVYGQIRRASSYSFIILPHWYQSDWAYTLFIFLFVVTALFLSRLLVSHSQRKALAEHQRLEEQRRKTEDMIRSQVAADFHDELGTRITRISLFSEILKNDLGEISESAESYLGKISKNADRLYDETRDFIWQLDPQKDTLTDFIGRIKSFGDEIFEDTDIQFEVEQLIENPSTIKLGMDQRRNLIRILKEALHNALKYAQCKNLLLKIVVEDTQIQFSIIDDGIGFYVEDGSDGIGLKNMRQRANKINADFEINSKPGEGTQLKLSIKI